MFDRVPRPARILALLAVFALGLALGVNAMVARLLTVDAERLAAATRDDGPASPGDTPGEEGGEPGKATSGPAETARAASPRTRRLDWYQDPIVLRNLFDSANALAGKPVEGAGDGAASGDGGQTEMDAVLLATAVASDPAWSTALIAVASTAPEIFRNGDPILDATIIDIRSPWLDAGGAHHPARVVVERHGRREHLDAGTLKSGARPKSEGKPVAAAEEERPVPGRHEWTGIRDLGGNKYAIDKAEIDYALSNIDKLGREARIVPNFQDGQASGFKVFSIRRNSALRMMGLKNNDVLTAVNGNALTDQGKALEMYSKLQSETNFTLEILRNGEPMTLEYSVQ